MQNEHIVAIAQQQNARYSIHPPYHPPAPYAEIHFDQKNDQSNQAYESVRELFTLLEYDNPNFGTAKWNPLGWLIKPGETVFIKPNMIAHKHEHTDEWEHVITHGSVIRAVVDYAFLALQGKGKIIIGDGCQSNSHFNKIVARMGLHELRAFYRQTTGFDIEILDLRDFHWAEQNGVFVENLPLPGDPRGKTIVDLGNESMLAELDGAAIRFYGATYDVDETNRHHSGGKHEYAFSRSPLEADVFINLPKLKTHKKCGLTVNLKSLVGLNANKNWLPHYVFGSPETGGDQFDRTTSKRQFENAVVTRSKRLLLRQSPIVQRVAQAGKKWAYRFFGTTDSVVRSGNWHGNDTVWRMSLDLNRILMYSNPDGTMGAKTKRFFSIVDGIIGMEGNGPVAGIRKEVGVLLGGTNPVAVDIACARLMGMDFMKLPILNRAFNDHRFPLCSFNHEDVVCVSHNTRWNKRLIDWSLTDSIPFTPHFGWKGRIELRSEWHTAPT